MEEERVYNNRPSHSECLDAVSRFLGPGSWPLLLEMPGAAPPSQQPIHSDQTIFLTAQARLRAISRRLKFVISSIISVFTAAM